MCSRCTQPPPARDTRSGWAAGASTRVWTSSSQKPPACCGCRLYVPVALCEVTRPSELAFTLRACTWLAVITLVHPSMITNVVQEEPCRGKTSALDRSVLKSMDAFMAAQVRVLMDAARNHVDCEVCFPPTICPPTGKPEAERPTRRSFTGRPESTPGNATFALSRVPHAFSHQPVPLQHDSRSLFLLDPRHCVSGRLRGLGRISRKHDTFVCRRSSLDVRA
jgi:hypothetical protein